ncbi:INO80 chromatin remodeling complex Ies1 [Plectosphaerella plurivora]|uniref:INO80 chromatin remodeling complex Ies1 n=1 Tax=Plectosphaerella plurivora TaxID=936078 RepID=A0A9P8VEA5_9PEZI|nr:INO80 chromatin remodeling complex Ies1 [Plectosphaerella plurivora]
MASRSPSSSADGHPGSDAEAPSSPPRHEGKSFMSQAIADDDTQMDDTQMDDTQMDDTRMDDTRMDDTRMEDMTPEPTEKPTRGKGKQNKESNHPIGKIRHLKKEDGEPLWRKDIQYDFLKAIFDDETAVFTNSYVDAENGGPKIGRQNFADLYIDTMSRSSKTSRVLREKLLSDRDAAKGMAMVCLLVNIGRMNTTLNFFPEMRAQLRTYHAIPSLQAHQDPHAYKQLQDAPRLKSILKGGAEDRKEPNTLNQIKGRNVPRTNPVNLLFVICAAAAKVAELHFPPGQEFHDLVMKTNFTSESRAKAFLWIMWFYLESDFTEEGCDENPFGSGVDYGVDVANQGVPRLVPMTEEEEEAENVDTQNEIEFGKEKQKMRAKILEADQQLIDQNKRGTRPNRLFTEDGPAILPRIRPSRHESDMDSTRSTPPPKLLSQLAKGSGRRGGAPIKYQMVEGSSPAPGQTTADGVISRKPRPPTAHQIAVERNRTQRVEHTLDQGLRKQHHKARKLRKKESTVYRAWARVTSTDNWLEDSDPDEVVSTQLAALGIRPASGKFRSPGLGGFAQLEEEVDDFGEEAVSASAALRRSIRRLQRWAPYRGTDKGVISTTKVRREKPPVEEFYDDDNDIGDQTLDPDATELLDVGTPVPKANGKGKRRVRINGDVNGDVALDDGDVTALGGNSGGEEEELDDIEQSLLGMAPGDDDSGSETE